MITRINGIPTASIKQNNRLSIFMKPCTEIGLPIILIWCWVFILEGLKINVIGWWIHLVLFRSN